MGDGYTMQIVWNRAFASPVNYNLAYNIYYSTVPFDMEYQDMGLIAEGPKFVSTNIVTLTATILDFTPGDTFYFVVRATQYDHEWFDLTQLSQDPTQIDGYLYVYPETLLSDDIDQTQTDIPITDIDLFPDHGVIQIGQELIRYLSKSIDSLTGAERGFFSTEARIHMTDGYDGYEEQDPIIHFWHGIEKTDLFVVQEQSTFTGHNIFSPTDGYRNLDLEGIVVSDSAANDADRDDFPPYDYVGWRRTQPSRLFTGTCVDTYIGGESFCADGYDGLNQQIRGIPLYEQADRLQETLLEEMGTGESCVLLKRIWNGITCSCVTNNQEYPDPRCGKCFGTGFIGGFEQYYNPRRLDSRILVRFTPSTEDVKMLDAGLESHIIYPCWTLTYPILDDRDVLIRFKPDGTEEWRYEIINVERNIQLFGKTGKQNFNCQRVRKTSILYQWRAIRSTADAPVTISTTVGLLRGSGGSSGGSIVPHIHTLTMSNNITTISQINQTTDLAEGHNHYIINGVLSETLGHTHSIILP
jgi:hypothetical protein